MSTKVTDLEEFLDEIWRPYWPAHPDVGPRRTPSTPENYREGLKRMGRRRHSLDETLGQLRAHRGTEWERMVIGRIAKVGYWFPAYIDHPLVRYIQQRVAEQHQQEK